MYWVASGDTTGGVELIESFDSALRVELSQSQSLEFRFGANTPLFRLPYLSAHPYINKCICVVASTVGGNLGKDKSLCCIRCDLFQLSRVPFWRKSAAVQKTLRKQSWIYLWLQSVWLSRPCRQRLPPSISQQSHSCNSTEGWKYIFN